MNLQASNPQWIIPEKPADLPGHADNAKIYDVNEVADLPQIAGIIKIEWKNWLHYSCESGWFSLLPFIFFHFQQSLPQLPSWILSKWSLEIYLHYLTQECNTALKWQLWKEKTRMARQTWEQVRTDRSVWRNRLCRPDKEASKWSFRFSLWFATLHHKLSASPLGRFSVLQLSISSWLKQDYCLWTWQGFEKHWKVLSVRTSKYDLAIAS